MADKQRSTRLKRSEQTKSITQVWREIDALEDIFRYGFPRQVGHTTAMLEGAKNVDCIVIVDSMRTGKYLEQMGFISPSKANPRYMTIDQAKRGLLRPYRKPILIDHFALQLIISDLAELRTQLTDLQPSNSPENALN